MKARVKLCFAVMILCGLLCMKAGRTDADLVAERRQNNNTFSATTLSFSSRNTANFDPLTLFFSVDHLQPNGYDVKSLRIQRDGKMDIQYRMSADKKRGDDGLCEALEITVMQNWKQVYKGSLFSLSYNGSLPSSGSDDLIIQIRLPKNDTTLRQKQCDFNLKLQTRKSESDIGKMGLWADGELQNSIRTGTW